MAPKKKGGSPKKKAAVPQTPEMLDVRKYQIAASIAEERSEMLRAMQEQQTSLLADRTTKLDRAAEETNELYTYLDTQMLASARERQGYEAQLRQAERRRKEELADLTTRMELQQATASEMIRALRVELKERSDEVEALHEHQLKGPERDAEIARLKEKLTREEQAIQEERSSMHLKEFKLRRDLNQEMYARIHQAKANFLDITGSMLDSTVHRTLLQNQHMQGCRPTAFTSPSSSTSTTSTSSASPPPSPSPPPPPPPPPPPSPSPSASPMIPICRFISTTERSRLVPPGATA